MLKLKVPRTVGQFIREKRIAMSMTQEALANELGYRAQFVTNWERGVSSPPARVLSKIIAVLEIPEEEMLQILFDESMRYWREQLNQSGKPARRRK